MITKQKMIKFLVPLEDASKLELEAKNRHPYNIPRVSCSEGLKPRTQINMAAIGATNKRGTNMT